MHSNLLIVLTHDYPASRGDASFLGNEINELAAHFGRVLVVPLIGPAHDPLPLPAGVSASEPVFPDRDRLVRRGLWNGSSLGRAAVLAREDCRLLRRPAHIRSLALATLVGRACASHRPLNRALAEHPRSVVYSFWGAGPAYALPWLPLSGHRTVVRFHRTDLYPDLHGGYLPWRRAILRAADAAVAISRRGAEELRRTREQLGLRTPVVLAKLGTPDAGASPEAVAGEPVHIVSCSAVIPVKRVQVIFEAVTHVARARPVRWTHFGDGAQFEGLKAQAARPIPGLTVDLRGRQPNRAVHEFYRSTHVDCFLNLSDSEGLPVSIMEALSYGIPAVATDAGGTKELVGPAQRTGLLLPVGCTGQQAGAAVEGVLRSHSMDPRRYWRQEHHGPTQAALIAAILDGDRWIPEQS